MVAATIYLYHLSFLLILIDIYILRYQGVLFNRLLCLHYQTKSNKINNMLGNY